MIKEILHDAEKYAKNYHHPYTGPIHILLAIAKRLDIKIPEDKIHIGTSPTVKGHTQTIFHLLDALSKSPSYDEIMEKLYKKHPYTKEIHLIIKKEQKQLLNTVK